jgi:DNA-binding response OmpR family regulator
MVHAEQCSARKYVLVVEDDPELNQLIGDYVALAGFDLISVANGSDALRQAHQRPIAAVVLDLMLPDINGLDVCRRLKADPDTKCVPVIMLTAMDSPDTRQEGLGCGAADYLTKPFDPDQFLNVLSHRAGTAEKIAI